MIRLPSGETRGSSAYSRWKTSIGASGFLAPSPLAPSPAHARDAEADRSTQNAREIRDRHIGSSPCESFGPVDKRTETWEGLPRFFGGRCRLELRRATFVRLEAYLAKHLLEDHKVIAAVGIPADADDVVAQGDGEVQHRAMLVVALEAEGLVFVLLGPGVHGVHELRCHALAAKVGQHAVEPRE